MKQRPITLRSSGFSLIEVLVTISLLGIILGSSTTLLKTVISNNKKSQSLNLLRIKGQEIQETVSRLVIGAKSIVVTDTNNTAHTCPVSAFPAVLQVTDLDNKTTTVSCIIDSTNAANNKITLVKDGVTTELAGGNAGVRVQSCTFYCINKSTYTLKFELTSISLYTAGESQDFSTTMVARNIPN